MDWVDDDGRVRTERGSSPGSWREPRSDGRATRKGLEDRLESWVTRGRDLVDGVSGTRPGTRPPGRGGERPGPGGRGSLEGLGRWVEGRLDWLLDDRDDWREPWQEADRPPAERWEDTTAPPPRPSRPPLEAISRRGGQPSAPRNPLEGVDPPRAAPPANPSGGRGAAASPPGAFSQEWPEEEAFSVPRWRRESASSPPPANPLADPAPSPPPGRPLPRSTRRR